MRRGLKSFLPCRECLRRASPIRPVIWTSDAVSIPVCPAELFRAPGALQVPPHAVLLVWIQPSLTFLSFPFVPIARILCDCLFGLQLSICLSRFLAELTDAYSAG